MFTCALGVACDEKLSEITGPTPNLNPSFSSINQNIIQSRDSSGRSQCILCHSGPTPAARLDLATDPYSALVNKPSREKPGLLLVAPGDPANSYLIQKLQGAPGISGKRMPQNGPPYLTDGQIQVIQRWIQAGAQDN
jgi:hypothetical protein